MREAVLQDLRHALRGFGRSPSFTLAALTLGIGTTTAVFSVATPGW